MPKKMPFQPSNDELGLNGSPLRPVSPATFRITQIEKARMMMNEPRPSTSCTRVEIATPRNSIRPATTQKAIDSQYHSMLTS